MEVGASNKNMVELSENQISLLRHIIRLHIFGEQVEEHPSEEDEMWLMDSRGTEIVQEGYAILDKLNANKK